MTDAIGRTAFITGGANGMGLGIARAFAREGVKLALVDIDAVALDRARDELAAVTEVGTTVPDMRDRDRSRMSPTILRRSSGRCRGQGPGREAHLRGVGLEPWHSTQCVAIGCTSVSIGR